jgi:L-threonylcarbamoyladenylate synthase
MQKYIYIVPTDTCYGIACEISDVKSYEKIYKIKKRSFEKPLAIMVPDFEWLEENTYLTDEQIDFLRSYDSPFTILCECPAIQALLQFDDDTHFYKNKDVYHKIAFRVAHTKAQEKLLAKIWPIFLTSANKSWQWEIYDYKDIQNTFEEYEHIIHTIWKEDLNPLSKSSDIFEFVDDTTEVQYLRKNK